MGVYIAGMRRRVGGAFGASTLAAVVVVGCGGRTADLPPDGSSGSSLASASGRANATSGSASGSTTGTVTEASGTAFVGSSGTVTATSGTTVFVGSSGTVAATSGTTVFIGSSGTVAATSGTTVFVGSSGTVAATSGTTVFIGSSGTEVATSGTTVFFGTSGTATSGTTTVTGASACGAGASTVPVSFANDLMPIFQNNCSVGGTDNATALCHGATMVNMPGEPGGSRQYFGPPAPAVNSVATLTAIYEGIVNESSSEDISMSLVAPGDPTQSFLWYKVNGIQTALDNENPDACARGDLGACGSPMPLPLTGSVVTLLPQADRDLICNWITQGALNN
jgi:hypothetical protein